MIITIKANGDIVNIKPEVFYQGSTEANKIYLIAPLSINSVVELNFTLPNLHEIKNILMTPSTKISDNLNTWVLDIPASITQRIGLVKVDIIIRVNDNIITVNRTQFEVKRGSKIELPEEPEINVYEQIVQALAQVNADYINKVDISYTDTENGISQSVTNNSNGLKLVKTVGDVTVTVEVTENGLEIDGVEINTNIENRIETHNTSGTAHADIRLIAETAEDNSEAAVATANEAKSIAENAESVALGIDAKATEALSNSEESVEIADDAKSIADEAKAIALSVEQAKVFDTFADMETWLKDEANKEKHSVGLELLIKDTNVSDYWIFAVLETPNASGYYYEIEATEAKFPNADQISDEETVNKWSTTGEKEKVSKIVINGDGTKALLNDGTYGEVGTVDTVNNVLPDENKNITITADDINYDEESSVKEKLDNLEDDKVDKEFSSDYAFTEGLVVTWKSDTNTYRVGDGTSTAENGYTGTAKEIIIPKFFDDGVHGIAPIDEIGRYAFREKTTITSVKIPNSITSIGNNSFSNCSDLTSITIPNSVTSIGNYAFLGCSSLKSITIPDSVTSIGGFAFYNCSSLTSVTIPENVTSIGVLAFYNCSNLTSITIPSSVTSIETQAFDGCSSLTKMTILATTPPNLSSNAISTATTVIYVPYASLTAYKNATNWSTYADRIFAIPEGKWIKEDLGKKLTVIKSVAELGLTAPASIIDVLNAVISQGLTNSIIIISNDNNNNLTGMPMPYGIMQLVTSSNILRFELTYRYEVGSASSKSYIGTVIRTGNVVSSVLFNEIPTKAYADSVGFARVYRSFQQLGIPNSATIAEMHAAMIDRSKAILPVSTYDHPTYGNTGLELPNNHFYVLEAIRSDNERLTLKLVGKASNSAVLYHYEGMYYDFGTTNKFTGWKRIINDEDAQTITGEKTFSGNVYGVQKTFTATLPSSSWTGSSAPYSKAVTVTGILATDKPTFDINFNGVYSDEQIARSNFGLVYKYVTSADTITFYADAVPTADIPLTIKVVR